MNRSPGYRQPLSILLMLALVLQTGSGCSFYKVKSRPYPDAPEVSGKVADPMKYIILHSGKDAWHLKNIVLNDERTAMSGILEDLPPEHKAYLKEAPRRNKPRRYKPSKEEPTYEVHLYLSDTAGLVRETTVSLPLSAISRIDIYDKDIAATIASYAGITLAVAGGVAVILAFVALATKSSCPFVYVRSDGDGWRFAGEMYGGAIHAPLERDDYMLLPGIRREKDGTCALRIANELMERQYTNIAELIVAEHPEGTLALADQQGTIHVIAAPEAAAEAITGGSAGQLSRLAARDSSSYLFDDEDPGHTGQSSLTLRFRRPPAAKQANLVLHAKNSFWLDYMFSQFTALFGTRYNEFAEAQKKVPATEQRQWSRDQSIPLAVYLETGNGWKAIEYIETMGPLAGRDLVVPVDLSEAAGNQVRIMLRCGLMFWELDYAAMDFGSGRELSQRHISASTAIDENGKDIAPLIAASDRQYLFQPEPGNDVQVTFRVPEQKRPGYTQSIFFHSRGYYEYIRRYTNKPDLLYLASFKKKGAFTRFAAQRYRAQLGRKDLLPTALNN